MEENVWSHPLPKAGRRPSCSLSSSFYGHSQINLQIISQGEIIDHLHAVHHSRSVMQLQSGLCSATGELGLLWGVIKKKPGVISLWSLLITMSGSPAAKLRCNLARCRSNCRIPFFLLLLSANIQLSVSQMWLQSSPELLSLHSCETGSLKKTRTISQQLVSSQKSRRGWVFLHPVKQHGWGQPVRCTCAANAITGVHGLI